MIPQLQMQSSERFTPRWVIDGAIAVMGRIDLDPCSSKIANGWVGATKFCSGEIGQANGLAVPWNGRILVNPPSQAIEQDGSMTRPGSGPQLFWQVLLDEYARGYVTDAIYVGYSVEQLLSLQKCTEHPLMHPTCIPRRRMNFVSWTGSEYVELKQPTHGNFITYLGDHVQRFREVFGEHGLVVA